MTGSMHVDENGKALCGTINHSGLWLIPKDRFIERAADYNKCRRCKNLVEKQ